MNCSNNITSSNPPWLQGIPSTWEVATLKTKANICNGATPLSGEDSYWDGDIPWATPTDLGNGDDLILIKTGRSITEAGYKSCGTTLVPTGSVILSTRAPIGSLGIAGVPMCFNQGCRGIEPIEGTDSKYLYYALASMNAIMQIHGEGTTFKELSSTSLANLKLCWPHIDEQIAIAAYLDAETKRIDWLINEKENLLKLLIELRGGIIRELTAGIHLKSAMQETGNVFMPIIPSDWDMSGIGRFSSLGNGSTPLKDNADYWNGGTYPWLNSSVVNQDEVTEGSELVTESALKLCHLPIVPPGSVLVALTGQGKTRGQATMLRIEATINQHLAYIQTDGERLDGEYLFWVLSGQFSALRMISDGQGGTKGALTCDDLRKFQIPLPPIKVQKDIAARLYEETRRVDDLVEYAEKEIAVLAELRSSTITDAVLGRIDVRKSQTH